MADVSAVSIRDPHWRAIAVYSMRLRMRAVPTPADRVAYARRELAADKTPTQWIVVDALPPAGSGNIRKFLPTDICRSVINR